MFTKDQLTVVVMTLFVWGFAGALFGALFAGLYQVLQMLGLIGWQPLIAAAALAAMTTSAFYSAMPVALVGAIRVGPVVGGLNVKLRISLQTSEAP